MDLVATEIHAIHRVEGIGFLRYYDYSITEHYIEFLIIRSWITFTRLPNVAVTSLIEEISLEITSFCIQL